ncbi:hypothetical protein BDF21DRAFT_495874 [Thamnidium elegans]|nr:hypothetical protein BDF21DRAFT_495874 [Thamnidium elegans]
MLTPDSPLQYLYPGVSTASSKLERSDRKSTSKNYLGDVVLDYAGPTTNIDDLKDFLQRYSKIKHVSVDRSLFKLLSQGKEEHPKRFLGRLQEACQLAELEDAEQQIMFSSRFRNKSVIDIARRKRAVVHRDRVRFLKVPPAFSLNQIVVTVLANLGTDLNALKQVIDFLQKLESK